MRRCTRAILHALLVSTSLLLPTALVGQSVEVAVRESVLARTDGEAIAVLEPGAPVEVVGRRDGWLEVAIEGWVWMRSLQVTPPSPAGYDLVVSAAEGENLRARPSGAVLGKLAGGTLLRELERTPGWVRARRVGWMRASAVALAGGARAATPQTPQGGRPIAPRAVASGLRTAGPAGAALLSGPSGDTVARTRGGAELQVVAREGGWARVRIEGWTWLPEDGAAGEEARLDASPLELAADPDRYRGRVVSWELQFLSHERAERIRTDFLEGEPFLLTRHGSGAYVYVALPPDRLAEAGALTPLERVVVTGRLRTAASALTGSPILDLLELERAPRR